MPTHYLRLEAVNLANFIEDTQDISTIRGAGLMLLRAIPALEAAAKQGYRPEKAAEVPPAPFRLAPISTGASSGLFRVEGDTTTPQAVCDWVRAWLRHTPAEPAEIAPHLQHATYVLSCIPATEHFPTDVETLIAQCRWQQMAAPSLAVPHAHATAPGVVCGMDQRRPATTSVRLPDKPDPAGLSAATAARRDFGRKQKQQFYWQELEAAPTPPGRAGRENPARALHFTRDLGQIAQAQPADGHGNLANKIAVLYADGNSFGAHQRKCKSPDDLGEWDKNIKRFRRQLLADLITQAKTDPRWLAYLPDEDNAAISNPHLRLETLLWGGDELIWVVPAWLGWETLASFFDRTKHCSFQGTPLSHSVGLVFCHHNAPIHRITHLAKDLAQVCKDHLSEQARQPPTAAPHPPGHGNLAAWVALESFDHTGGNLGDYLQRRYHGAVSWPQLLLSGPALVTLNHHLAILRESLPKRRIYLAAHAAVDAARLGTRTACDHASKQGEAAQEAAAQAGCAPALEAFLAALPGAAGWITLVEMWDYAGLTEKLGMLDNLNTPTEAI